MGKLGVLLRAPLSEIVSRGVEHGAISSLDDASALVHGRFGDDDGGRAVRLGDHDYYRPMGLLAAAAALFNRGDFKHLARDVPEEIFWVFGADAGQRYQDLPAAPPSRLSYRFGEAQVTIARTGWDEHDLWLAYQAQPMGFLTAGQSHAGLLSFELCMNGEPVLIDPGTFTYSRHDGWRDHFRDAPAHNVAQLDEDQVFILDGPFGWRNSTRGLAVTRPSDRELRAGYQRELPAQGTIVHSRIWHIESPRALRLTDEFDGSGRHRLIFWFHFPPGARLCMVGRERVSVLLERGTMVELVLEGFSDPRPIVREGSLDPLAGWASPGFDRKVPAPVLSIADEASFPTRRTVRLVCT